MLRRARNTLGGLVALGARSAPGESPHRHARPVPGFGGGGGRGARRKHAAPSAAAVGAAGWAPGPWGARAAPGPGLAPGRVPSDRRAGGWASRAAVVPRRAAASSAPGAAPPRAPVQVIVDFDETITERDSTAVLGQLAAQWAAEEGGPRCRDAARAEWDAVVSRFAAECRAHSAADPVPPRGAGMAAVRAWFDRHDAFDRRMADAVSASRALAGMTLPFVREHGPPLVAVREGAAPALRRLAIRPGTRVAVVSVHFSAALVSATLASEGVAAEAVGAPAHGRAGTVAVLANELETDSAGAATGAVLPRVHSAIDKADAVRALARSAGPAGAGATVYVGDSPTDFLAMAESDWAVVVGDSASLRGLLEAARDPELEARFRWVPDWAGVSRVLDEILD